MNFSINKAIYEGKTVTIKRRYTDAYPEYRAAIITPVREKVLSFVKENGSVSKTEFVEFLKTFNEETGRNTTFRWVRENKHLFHIVKENGENRYKLSKLGQRVLERTRINENVNINDVLNEDYSDSLIKLTAKKLGTDLTPYDMKQIKIGMAVELKHGSKFGDVTNITGDDPVATMQIVLGNLSLNSKYYTEPKPEDWGELEAEMDASTSDTTDGIDNPVGDEDKKNDVELTDDTENKTDDKKSETDIDLDLDLNIDKDKTKSDETKKSTNENTELSEDDKQRLVEFLEKAVAEDYSNDKFISQLSIVGNDIGKDYEELKKKIYSTAMKGIKDATIDVSNENISDDDIEKLEASFNDKGKINDTVIGELAKKFDIEEKYIKELVFDFAIKEFGKRKLTKDSDLETDADAEASDDTSTEDESKKDDKKTNESKMNEGIDVSKMSDDEYRIYYLVQMTCKNYNNPAYFRSDNFKELALKLQANRTDLKNFILDDEFKLYKDPDELFIELMMESETTGFLSVKDIDNKPGKYSVKKIWTFDDFLNNPLITGYDVPTIYEKKEDETDIWDIDDDKVKVPKLKSPKKYDKIIKRYFAAMEDLNDAKNKFVNAFKTEMDSKKKEKLKIDHIANMKKLNTELDAAKKDYDKIVNKITGADILYDEEE